MLVVYDFKINFEYWNIILQSINTIVENKGKVLWALQEPVNDENLAPEQAIISNTQVDLYNRAAMEVSEND